MTQNTQNEESYEPIKIAPIECGFLIATAGRGYKPQTATSKAQGEVRLWLSAYPNLRGLPTTYAYVAPRKGIRAEYIERFFKWVEQDDMCNRNDPSFVLRRLRHGMNNAHFLGRHSI